MLFTNFHYSKLITLCELICKDDFRNHCTRNLVSEHPIHSKFKHKVDSANTGIIGVALEAMSKSTKQIFMSELRDPLDNGHIVLRTVSFAILMLLTAKRVPSASLPLYI